MGGDLTIEDLLKKPIKVGYTTLAMENRDEHNPTAERTLIRDATAYCQEISGDQRDKKKLLWYMFEQGEISRETYDERVRAMYHGALDKVADRAAEMRLDPITRMRLPRDQIRLMERFGITESQSEALLSHFSIGTRGTQYQDSSAHRTSVAYDASVEYILNASSTQTYNTSQNASSTEIGNTSKGKSSTEIGNTSNDESAMPSSSSHSDLKKKRSSS